MIYHLFYELCKVEKQQGHYQNAYCASDLGLVLCSLTINIEFYFLSKYIA